MKHLFFAVLVLVAAVGWTAEGENEVKVNADRLNQRFTDLSQYGKNPAGGMDRFAFSDADIESRPFLKQSLEDAGLEVHVDEAGNIFGRREGSRPDLPPIVFGSHTDSVANGGMFDGPVGTLSAIEVAQTLNENKITTLHPLEVVILSLIHI